MRSTLTLGLEPWRGSSPSLHPWFILRVSSLIKYLLSTTGSSVCTLCDGVMRQLGFLLLLMGSADGMNNFLFL